VPAGTSIVFTVGVAGGVADTDVVAGAAASGGGGVAACAGGTSAAACVGEGAGVGDDACPLAMEPRNAVHATKPNSFLIVCSTPRYSLAKTRSWH